MFGMSFVYVVFEEGTDIVLGALARPRVPQHRAGPAARWTRAAHRPRRERASAGSTSTCSSTAPASTTSVSSALQDYSLRYALASVPGVSEVASVGGFEPQYQVTSTRPAPRAIGVSLADVARRGPPLQRRRRRARDRDVRARVLRARPRLRRLREDLEPSSFGRAKRARRCGCATSGRCRWAERSAAARPTSTVEGEVVSGIVVMRYGENALDVIGRVEKKLDELRPSLPDGRRDRDGLRPLGLIERAIETLRTRSPRR
jgi:Cu(I)/Ag(I) efflux system membrane protein CusA/SilA